MLIFYFLAYHEDSQHVGDSEFIDVHLSYDSGSEHWRVDKVMMSAHFNTWGDHTQHFYPSELEFDLQYHRGRPRAYVAKGKHASYASRHICDDHEGHSFLTILDDCVEYWDGVVEYVGIVPASGNTGSDTHRLVDCTYSRDPVTNQGLECFWSNGWFGGWQEDIDFTVPGYGEILAFFGLATGPSGP